MLMTIIFKKYLDENFYMAKKIFFFQLCLTFIFYLFYPLRNYLILSILLIISIIDIKEYIIPNYLILFLIVIKALDFTEINLYFDPFPLVFLFILFILSFMDLGLGMGDVKLLFSIFILNGGSFFIQLLMVISILIFFVGLYFLIMKKGKTYKFPLAPFVLLAYLLI